jgi:hypothetical protein
MPRFFISFIPNQLGFGFKTRGLQGHVSSVIYFSNLLKDKGRRLKINLTLNLILRVNLRFRGYSIWSASSITPHIKEDLITTRGMSTIQPRCSQKSTRKTPSQWNSGELKDAFRSTRKPAVLDYEELGACRPCLTGLCTWRTSYSIRGGAWPMPYTSCNYSWYSKTTRVVVELVGIEGNYSSSTR